MSLILKAILSEYREWKMADIFQRAKTMDTWEIYDELYGRKPPIPPPACARLQYIEPFPLWACGMIWWPDGPELVPRAYSMDVDAIPKMPLDLMRRNPGLFDLWPSYIGMIPSNLGADNCSIEYDPDGLGYKISCDITFSIPWCRCRRGMRRERRHQLHPKNPFHKTVIYKYK